MTVPGKTRLTIFMALVMMLGSASMAQTASNLPDDTQARQVDIWSEDTRMSGTVYMPSSAAASVTPKQVLRWSAI